MSMDDDLGLMLRRTVAGVIALIGVALFLLLVVEGGALRGLLMFGLIMIAGPFVIAFQRKTLADAAGVPAGGNWDLLYQATARLSRPPRKEEETLQGPDEAGPAGAPDAEIRA